MDNIETKRKEIKMPVTELTNKINVSRSVYYQWLRGEKKPKLENVYKMCKILNLDFNLIYENILNGNS